MKDLENGTVIRREKEGRTEFWKITGIRAPILGLGEGYSVIRCSPNGKSFKEKNGFTKSWVHKQIEDGAIKIVTQASVLKQENKRKRRIQFLKARIARDTEELKGLLGKEG